MIGMLVLNPARDMMVVEGTIREDAHKPLQEIFPVRLFRFIGVHTQNL
jgi:hypothetical protein